MACTQTYSNFLHSLLRILYKKDGFPITKSRLFLLFGQEKTAQRLPDGFPFERRNSMSTLQGTSDFIRLLSFSEKPPVLQFCAYGFPLPVERYKKHLKTAALFGGLLDTDAAAASFVHENKHPLRCILLLYRIGIYKRLPGLLLGLASVFPLQGIPYRMYKFVHLAYKPGFLRQRSKRNRCFYNKSPSACRY